MKLFMLVTLYNERFNLHIDERSCINVWIKPLNTYGFLLQSLYEAFKFWWSGATEISF